MFLSEISLSTFSSARDQRKCGRGSAARELFGVDYWPRQRPPSPWRLLLGLALSPLATLGPTLLLAFLLYQFSESDAALAWSMTREAGVEFFTALYAPLLIGSALGGAALWALRLRSRRAFAATGATLGAAAGGLVYAIDGMLPPAVAVYALISGALALLALRAIAGLREPGRE